MGMFRDSGLSRQAASRRRFLQFLASSPLFAAAQTSFGYPGNEKPNKINEILNISQLDYYAREKLSPPAYHFIVAAADDGSTKRANRAAFERVRIRPRRLVDTTGLDTSVSIFARRYPSPIILAPVGNQALVHEAGDLATARAAASRGTLMILAMLSNASIAEIASAGASNWLQLYPSRSQAFVRHLMDEAAGSGIDTIVLTIDGPDRGNREAERWFAMHRDRTVPRSRVRLGNFESFEGRKGIGDAKLTWERLAWYRDNTDLKLVLKGVVTAEDARLCLEHGADGLVVSNHGGRQEGHGRGTLAVLPEIVETVKGRIPVLIDGGIRRGADVFKALALGADAACIGRPYLWGLGAFGEAGVGKCLDVLQAELERTMRLAGTPTPADIRRSHVWPER
jgi:isopentenyl diphosphate isomerase/L-lactate dehydrogenase-like FMN-dependent dehydrogenase